MPQHIVDPKTGKVTFKPVEKKEGESTPVEGQYILLPLSYKERLTTLAYNDGFEADAETEKGQQIQLSRAMKTYTLLALDMYFATREAGDD